MSAKLQINRGGRMLLFLCLLNLSIAGANATGVSLIKYGYGKIYWGKKASTAEPVVYPLSESSAFENLIRKQPNSTIADLYPYYRISEKESKWREKKYAIDVFLAVRQEKNNVIANITFNNKSNKSYFIYKSGIPSTARDIFFGVICGSSFLITTDNVKLDYLGHSCDFGNDIQDWWLEIESGESFSYTIPLNRAYEFLPGKHQYQIGSLEYPIITKEWFSEKNMHNKMFSIFNWRSSCSMKTDYPLVLKRRFLCPRYEVDKNNLRRVLNNFGFNGNSSDYYFEIRTNQVSILIDANKNTSYYQFTENKLKGHKKIIMKK